MFRQTIVLACFIALAVASDEAWFGIGARVEGDQNLSNQTTTSLETSVPTQHSINLLFFGGANTFTFGRFDVYGVSSFIYLFFTLIFNPLFFFKIGRI